MRRAAGLTQAALAARAGVNQQMVSRLESGLVREPSYRVVVRLCRALNVLPERVAEFRAWRVR